LNIIFAMKDSVLCPTNTFKVGKVETELDEYKFNATGAAQSRIPILDRKKDGWIAGVGGIVELAAQRRVPRNNFEVCKVEPILCELSFPIGQASLRRKHEIEAFGEGQNMRPLV
jgi:hypothetical protein